MLIIWLITDYLIELVCSKRVIIDSLNETYWNLKLSCSVTATDK